MIRNVQRRLAHLASSRPIELIVGVFCLVTLAYFQLLHAVTHSNFFEPLNQEVNRNHNGIFVNDEWWNFSWGADKGSSSSSTSGGVISNGIGLDSNGDGMVYVLKAGSKDWIPLSQLLIDEDQFNLDETASTYFIDPILILNSDSTSTSSLRDATLPSIASTLKSQLSSTTSISSPQFLKDSDNQSVYSLALITQDSSSSSSIRKSTFLSLSSFEFLDAVLKESNSSESRINSKKGKENVGQEKQKEDLRLLPLLPDSFHHRSGATEELRSIRWAAYAIRALIVRFWALIKVSFEVLRKEERRVGLDKDGEGMSERDSLVCFRTRNWMSRYN